MDVSLLPAIFRQALRASLVVPLVAACAGKTTPSGSSNDSGTHADPDASPSDASTTDGGCDPNESCAAGGCECGSTTPACVDGQWQCGCAACPPPVDSGNVCKPNLSGGCGTTPIPLSCFDGGLPDAASSEMPASGSTCEALCGAQAGGCYVGTTEDGGPVALQCIVYCSLGRLFAGFRSPRPRRGSTLHRHFAHVACMEAASVDAFQILAGELVAHDAPADLVARAKEAARDEARHWKMTRPLAHRYGASVTKPKRAPKRPVRPLVDIAIENAVEGCVRETYGAVVAHHQAIASHDEEVRKVMTEIAEDETRHAILSWELASWADARLTATERARVARARARAVREMAKALSEEVPAELVTVAGMPDAASAQRMAASLGEALWS